ncbi:MAG: hypothetical protein K9M84_05205 [Spirochaetia bacterium]|nr:hypothetical protein [Spirochaetia bacterium]
MYEDRGVPAFSFIILVREHYRNRPEERQRLERLLKHSAEIHRVPVYLLMCKRNNIPLSHVSLLPCETHPVVFEEYLSAGHYLNSVMKMVQSPYGCVLWSDMIPEIHLDSQLTGWLLSHTPLCAVPILTDSSAHILPSLSAPVSYTDRQLRTAAFLPGQDGAKTLYPTDYAGIYDMQQLNGINGFDTTFEEGYWQLCDLGFTTWLRGRTIRSCNGATCRYSGSTAIEDQSPTSHSRRFHAKHFGYTIDSSGLPVVGRGQKKHLPHSVYEEYRYHPISISTTGRSLISNWESEGISV